MNKLLTPLLLLPLLLLAACHKDEPDPADPSRPGNRTVLIYMVAQNSMGNQLQQVRDSLEIMRGVPAMGADNRLLLYIDDAKLPRLYYIHPSLKQPQLVRTWDRDVNSASPEVLADVLGWSVRNYPSADYGLVLWSHGTGWIPSTNKDYSRSPRPLSFGIDVGPDGRGDRDESGMNYGAQMDVADMAAAIESTGTKMRYIFFDACLMQSLETCYALRHAADYIVASPISIHIGGADYDHQVRSGLFSQDPADIARTYYEDICDPGHRAEYSDYGIVISAVRTDQLDNLAQATAAALPHSAATGQRSPDMSGVLNYALYSPVYDYRPHNYDAAEAMRRLLPAETYAAFSEALGKAVVYKAATPRFYIGSRASYQNVDLDSYGGIALFVPQTAYSNNAGICPYGDLNEAFRQTEWYEAAGWATTGW